MVGNEVSRGPFTAQLWRFFVGGLQRGNSCVDPALTSLVAGSRCSRDNPVQRLSCR